MRFAAPPTASQRAAWAEADRAARPERLKRLRERMTENGVDGYFGLRWEHMRYLTGFSLAEGEEKSAGNSGQLLVTGSEVVVLRCDACDSLEGEEIGRPRVAAPAAFLMLRRAAALCVLLAIKPAVGQQCHFLGLPSLGTASTGQYPLSELRKYLRRSLRRRRCPRAAVGRRP